MWKNFYPQNMEAISILEGQTIFVFLGQFLTLENTVTKFFQNSNFLDFLGIKSEIFKWKNLFKWQKINPNAEKDRKGQNKSVEWTRLFGRCLGHRDQKSVVPMRAHRPFLTKNGRCAVAGEEKPRVVGDF